MKFVNYKVTLKLIIWLRVINSDNLKLLYALTFGKWMKENYYNKFVHLEKIGIFIQNEPMWYGLGSLFKKLLMFSLLSIV